MKKNLSKSNGFFMVVLPELFTLIELIIIIMIIAVLVSLLLPALSKARDKARTIQCINNFMTLGKGITYYMSDNNDWLSPMTFGRRMWWSRSLSTRVIAPYVGDEPVADPYSEGNNVSEGSSKIRCPAGDYKAETTIAMNSRLMSMGGQINHFGKSSNWEKTSQLCLALDGLKSASSSGDAKGDPFPYRHLNRNTTLFSDMHVVTLRAIPVNINTWKGFHPSAWLSYFWNPSAWGTYTPITLEVN